MMKDVHTPEEWWPLPFSSGCCSAVDFESDEPALYSKRSRQEDEVMGWTLDAATRGVILIATAVFVSSELLRLAKEATGCMGTDEEMVDDDGMYDENCEEARVYGMKPTSILTNIVTVTSLLSAFIMPLFGSIVDHTDHRRAVGSISAAAIAIFILVQMLVIEEHWFSAAILQVVISLAYTIHLTVVYAYFPELTADHDEMAELAARFTAVQYGTSVAFLISMVVVLETFYKNTAMNSAIISQGMVFIICCFCFGYSWMMLFHPRQATQKVPENTSLLTAGFWKIYKTGNTILRDHDAIKWVLLSVSFTEAGATTFSTVAITYMTEQLGFTAQENGIAILILLLFSVPGAKIAARLTSIFNPIRSLQACLCLWIVTIVAASVFLKDKGQQPLTYIFAAFWGVALGWTYPTEKTLYVTIIPRGQEAELMGTYICACQMLSWLPPLVFTLLNEAGFSMRLGVSSLAIFMFISVCVLCLVGDYSEAVAHAQTVDKERKQLASEISITKEENGYKELE
jgi:MFS-type transporter involved in bile tolerance (Atg22 family)